jgi:hypothetical protein
MKKTIVISLAFMLLFFGCATWVAVGGKHSQSSQNFEVELPEGWRKLNTVQDKILITRDGLALQQIHVLRRSVDKELAFTKKKLAADMMPQEMAEVLKDNIRSNPNITNQQFISDTPAQIGGHPGLKLVYTYQTKDGLTKKGIIYCLMLDNWCYEILYEAPERHYFSKDLPAFNQVKESFRLIKDSTT